VCVCVSVYVEYLRMSALQGRGGGCIVLLWHSWVCSLCGITRKLYKLHTDIAIFCVVCVVEHGNKILRTGVPIGV